MEVSDFPFGKKRAWPLEKSLKATVVRVSSARNLGLRFLVSAHLADSLARLAGSPGVADSLARLASSDSDSWFLRTSQTR
jgi:hypothetical protein